MLGMQHFTFPVTDSLVLIYLSVAVGVSIITISLLPLVTVLLPIPDVIQIRAIMLLLYGDG